MANQYTEQLKRYTILKKEFAKQFGQTEKTVQNAFDAVAAYILSKEVKTITPSELVTISTDPASILHGIFDWTKTPEYREAQATLILDNINVILASNNKIYRMTKQG